MDGFRNETADAQFRWLEDQLCDNIARLEFAEDTRRVDKIRMENARLETSIRDLLRERHKLKRVKNFLLVQNTNAAPSSDGNNNDGGRETHAPVDDVTLNMMLQLLLDRQEEALDYGTGERKEPHPGPNVSRPRKRRMQTSKQAPAKKKVIIEPSFLTRRQKTSSGGTLINPFKYHDCLLCKGGFYREKDLREHYGKKHSLDFGTAALPASQLEVRCQQFDRQALSKTCAICHAQFTSAKEVLVHKSNHVKSSFGKYQCSLCQQKLVLANEMENHVMTHDL